MNSPTRSARSGSLTCEIALSSAAERAGIELDVATDLLSKAEAALQRGDYGAARRQAEEARTHAIEAQKLASTASES